MAKLSVKEIRHEAWSALSNAPEGLRFSEIRKAILSNHPETPYSTVSTATHAFLNSDPKIVKVSKGFYSLAKNADPVEAPFPDVEHGSPAASVGQLSNLKEESFYLPFADWLRDELDEVVIARALGGNVLKSKWGTPDVIGVLKPLKADFIKFEPQIVSAEIKIDPAQPIVAFGQAVAYKLFSHKCYIGMPSSLGTDDLDRLEALAIIYGIGLVTFDLNENKPNFRLHVRAQLSLPDMFYVNQMAKRIHSYSAILFEELF